MDCLSFGKTLSNLFDMQMESDSNFYLLLFLWIIQGIFVWFNNFFHLFCLNEKNSQISILGQRISREKKENPNSIAFNRSALEDEAYQKKSTKLIPKHREISDNVTDIYETQFSQTEKTFFLREKNQCFRKWNFYCLFWYSMQLFSINHNQRFVAIDFAALRLPKRFGSKQQLKRLFMSHFHQP